MFISKVVIDIETGHVIERVVYDYAGPVELAKGDSTAQAAEQQQASFNQQLMSTFQQQFATQSNTLSYLKAKMQPMIDNPTGLSDTALAAARTSATDATAQGVQNAQQALNAKMTASGDSQLPSGVGAQLNAALLNSGAAQQATNQNQITMQNEQLKQTNYWNAVNSLSGVAAQNNPLGYASGATAGSGAVAGLSQAVTAANGPGIGQILGGLAGSALGAAGNAASGGATGGLSALFGCWLASRIWNGSLDPRTLLVRNYIHGPFAQSWYGAILSCLYLRYGLWASSQPFLVKLLTPAFNSALRSAQGVA